MATLSASQARAALPEVLDRVAAGEEITITRHGEAIAVVVRPDALRVRRADRATADAERVRQLLELARTRPLLPSPSITPDRAERLVADVRAARRRR
ncbi:MAG: type II toxin-antitoxin system Phd/YefM family antitoxin [Ilumatobacteraceae bacterium]|nr:type II toxin-antitoxin system Phd/YefM family antitoxin [Ilumatobacteraceae bacterium]